MLSRHTFILLLLCFTMIVYGNSYRFESLSVEQGLSDITVRSIYQDEVNRIWIATFDGLNCYDGNSIREFRQQTWKNQTINTHRISAITGNQNGLLFLKSISGVIEFDLHTERMSKIYDKNAYAFCYHEGALWLSTQHYIRKYDVASKKIVYSYKLPFPDIIVNNMIVDASNEIWLVTRNYGLLAFSPEKGMLKRYFDKTHGRTILEDRDGNLWYTTQTSGVYVIDRNGVIKKRYVHNPVDNNSISDGYNRAITQDAEGNIWLGTNLGLTCIHSNSNRISRYRSSTLPSSLQSSSINTLITDNRGTIWIGTYFGGVSYFNPGMQHYSYIVSNEENKPAFPAIGSFCEDNQGQVWVGSEGGGVYCYDPVKQTLDNFNTVNSNISSNYIKEIYKERRSNNIWIVTDNSGVLNQLDPVSGRFIQHPIILSDKESPRAIYSIEIFEKTLFLGTELGLIAYDVNTRKSTFVYKEKDQFNAYSNDLLIDSKRRLWFANMNTVISYSLDDFEFTYYNYNINVSQLESNGIANLFFEDKSGQIFLGTNGYGVLKLNEEEKIFSYTPLYEDVSGYTIKAIVQTQDGNMLISTTKSLFIKDKSGITLSQVNSSMGFPLKILIKRGLYVSNNGDVYIGGVPFFVIYNDKDLVANIRPDYIQLSELYINNTLIKPGDETGILKKVLPYTSKLTLKPSQNYLTLVYSTDNYFKTNDNKIEYRLKGYDQTWVPANFGHAISYTNLKPGNYNFEIRSKDNPTAIKSLKIKVNAPFYATIWAYLFYLILSAVIAYYLIREYHTRINLRASLAYQEREKQQIEAMNQSKIRFFVNISHEIRTPITLVLAQTEVLLNAQNLHAKTRSKILNIHRNLLNLKHLVTELMDFRKQEKGELVLKYTETDLVALLREHYHLFNGLGETRNIQFSFVTHLNKLMVWVDSEQLIKVVNNLTINAFKFSKESGSVTISLQEDKEFVYIKFEDTGIGIPQNEIDKIFNRFYSAANADSIGGTGIGLALSKGIVEAHHGAISVESEEGVGSVFTVKLPKGTEYVPQEQRKLNNEPVSKQYNPVNKDEIAEFIPEEDLLLAEEERPMVLVVEDNKELCDLIADTLSEIYLVEKAYDGQEGWEKARAIQPHLIITDVMMPRLSGVELCVRIKKSFELCHIPVILLTARQSDEYEIEGLRIGADSYLTKPFEFRKLIIMSNNLINSRRLIQNKFRQNRKLINELPATNEHDQEFINRVSVIIAENLENEAFSVDILASAIGVSRTKLFGKIKDITGNTPNNLIQEMRLNKAADYLLNHPEMNVADIAYQLCFNSPRYFNKCFKELFGMAPAHYKKENTKQNEPDENAEIAKNLL